MAADIPKIFISYCWTSPSHKEWVRNLAESLMGDGVEVVLDIWDAKDGADLNYFMETMVRDSSIDKVLMIFDQKYVDRSNARERGVGAEAQIISQEVFGKADQEKFIGIVRELDHNGDPIQPIYYSGRKFIDFSDDSVHLEQYEYLLRFLHDKPLVQKPKLGSPPAFDDPKDALPASLSFSGRSIIEAVKLSKPSITGLLETFLNDILREYENLKILEIPSNPVDEEVFLRIDKSSALLKLVVDVFECLARFEQDSLLSDQFSVFLEKMAAKTSPSMMGRYRTDQFDNMYFYGYELVLHFSAILISRKRFVTLDRLLSHRYYMDAIGRPSDVLYDYTIFCNQYESFTFRNQRLSLNRASLLADKVKERCGSGLIEHKLIMQADLFLFLRAAYAGKVGKGLGFWYPVNLVYLEIGTHRCVFEVFIRAQEKSFFEKFKVGLGCPDKISITNALDSSWHQDFRFSLRSFGHSSPYVLSGAEFWGTN